MNTSVFHYKTSIVKNNLETRNAAFDLDDTLVYHKSTIWCPYVKKKLLQLYASGYNIIVISNQKYNYINDTILKKRLQDICDDIDIPLHIYCARREDNYRKPNIGMLEFIKGKLEFYVGDAAGREKDFSDCDLQFAKNAKIPFYISDKYFLPYPMINNIPESLKTINGVSILTGIILINTYKKINSLKHTFETYSLKSFIFSNYISVNQLELCEEALSRDRNIVVDIFNMDRETRKLFIEMIKKNNARCVGIHIISRYDKEFQEPEYSEGFDDLFIYNIIESK